MAKREPEGFETHQQKAFDALERRKAAEKAIVDAVVNLERAPVGPLRVALWEPLMAAVRKYNQAEADFRAAQNALDERARKR